MGAVALVVFVDIRGFSSWSDSVEVFPHLDEFVSAFMGLVQKAFGRKVFMKNLGDGAMIVRELSAADSDPVVLLDGVLAVVGQVEEQFSDFCKEFEKKIGHGCRHLRLGWGITRGNLRKIQSGNKADYVGTNVNKCARLCDAARPFGIVLDYADFEDLPSEKRTTFHEQVRKLSGVGETPGWVTAEVVNKFVAREKLRQQPEVHVAGFCIDTSSKRGPKILVARRNKEREFFPDKLEGCGGQLARGESFVGGVRRHFSMEMGIQVNVLQDFHLFYAIEEAGHPYIPGIRFLCTRVDEKEPVSPNHSEIRWVSESDFRSTLSEAFVGNLKTEGLELLERWKKSGKK